MVVYQACVYFFGLFYKAFEESLPLCVFKIVIVEHSLLSFWLVDTLLAPLLVFLGLYYKLAIDCSRNCW